MSVLLLLIRASIVLAAALAGARLLRRSAATTRHAGWTMAFIALLALPALPSLLPAITVPVPVAWQPGAGPSPIVGAPRPSTDSVTLSEVAPAHAVPALLPPRTANDTRLDRPAVAPATVVALVWLAGTITALGALCLSLLRVRGLNRAASELSDVEWRAAADRFAARLGCAPPSLRVSAAIKAPMAGGISRPTIFLPASAARWSAECRDIVLAHETAHLARKDPLRHVAARVALACYWFHPLAWLAASRAAAAREEACDESVLALGTRPSVYAQVLLDFSEARPVPALSAALPIAEPSLLEKRLMAILAHDARRSVRRRPVLVVAAVAAVALGAAAAHPAAHTPAAAVDTVMPVTGAGEVQEPAAPGESRCDSAVRGAFTGSRSSSSRDGREVVYDMIGTSGADRIVMRTLGDLQVCMIAEGAAGDDRAVKPSDWPSRAARSFLQSRKGTATQRLDITREGAAQRVRWSVNGTERAFDATAEAWRDAMLALLDASWEASSVRGEVSSMRGEISSLRGEESSMRGEISSLRGEVSALRGEISSARGDESSLRGEISSIQGHVSSLRGQISAERGSISSLNASRYDMSDAERARVASRVREHEQEIARLEREIDDYHADAKVAAVEERIRNLNTEKKVDAVESQIRSANTEARIAAIEKRIAGLNVDARAAEIEKRIVAVDADRRVSALEQRIAAALKRLQDAIARIR